jgi:hypothetical protein
LVTVTSPAGSTVVTTSFAGSSTFAPVTIVTPFTVTREETTVDVETPAATLAGSTATLSGSLREDGIRPISGRTLTLTLGSKSCAGVTNTLGVATCAVTAPTTLGPTATGASFAGDADYVAATDSGSSIVYAYPSGGGAFVIGDRSTNGTVTFWGSQWAKSNNLSSGSAPSAFKGYALHGATSCGTSWSTDPGDSASPPSSIPAYMAVVVTSSARKSGSAITGDTSAIVVVKTSSGYSSNPGHAGTGTVVATICG